MLTTYYGSANYADRMTSVAIVMRTYERPLLLVRALASVCQQTFSDWHLVVVNNGGDIDPVDHAVALSRLSYPDSQITVLHLSNRVGMEEASNEALRASHSEYFAVHDDDDSWNPQFLERTVHALGEHSFASAVVTGVVRVHETFRGDRVWPVQHEKFYLTPERLTFDGMIGNNTFPPIAALFRRSLLDNVGYFDASLHVLGDWEFNLRAVEHGPFVFLPDRLAHYHTRTPDSDSAAGNSIIVGQQLHQQVKQQLLLRWESDVRAGDVSKAELSRMAFARSEEEDARRDAEVAERQRAERTVTRRIRRVVRAMLSPRRGGRAIVRRLRVKVNV